MKYLEKIKKLRLKIQETDKVIIKNLANRLNLVKEIGELKTEHNLDYVDVTREKFLIDFYKDICKQHQISAELIIELSKVIFKHCRKIQKST